MAAANGGNFLKNLKKPITQVVCKIAEKFQRLYLYFMVQEFNEAIFYIVGSERKSEIQDGGFQRGNTNISACIQHNWKIPKDKHMFSRLYIRITLFSILCNGSGSQKSKMAAHKPEILISQPVYNITAKFKFQINWCYKHVFRGCEIPLSDFLHRVTQADISNPKWRVTNRKYLYLSLCTILPRNSNNYTYVFEVQEFNEAILYFVWCKRKAKIQDGDSQTRNTHVCQPPCWISDLACFTTIKTSSIEFYALANIGIAVGIFRLRCIQAEI